MAAYLSDQEKAWWHRTDDEPELKAHERLQTVIDCMQKNQSSRKHAFLLYGAMYGANMPSPGGGLAVDAYVRTTPNQQMTVGLNVSRSVVDAAVAKIAAKSKPALRYLTNGGDYEKQDQAARLTMGVEGTFAARGYYPKALNLFRRAGVYGTGFQRIKPNYDRKVVEYKRMQPWECLMDDGEAVYETPRSFYTVTYEDQGVLAHEYQDDEYKHERIIRQKGDRDDDAEFGYQNAAMRIRVIEGWHRPSGRGATDGRHVRGIKDCTLVDEPWDGGQEARWDHPNCFGEFSWYYWAEPLLGFYGQGLVEIGREIQLEINKLVQQIHNGHHLITGHWMVEQNSKVLTSHLNNDLGAIVKYAGTRPEYVSPTIISPEVYTHLWNLAARYYMLAGINEQAAAAQKPQGLDSGEAQRVYADQQTETLLEKGQRWEEFVKLSGQQTEDAARALADDGAYEVRAAADDAFETIDWKELPDPDEFEITVAATSSLPGTLSGKIQLAYDMLKIGGQIDAADIMDIVGMGDMLQKTRRKRASARLVEKKTGLMLRRGETWEPHSLLNLQEALVIATEACNEAEEKGVDDDKLQLVRDFVVKLKDLIKQGAPTPPPQAIGPGGVMMGPGAAPPAPPGGVAMGGPPAPPPPGM